MGEGEPMAGKHPKGRGRPPGAGLSTEHSLHPMWGWGLSAVHLLLPCSTVQLPGVKPCTCSRGCRGASSPAATSMCCGSTQPVPARSCPAGTTGPTAFAGGPAMGPGWAGSTLAGPPGLDWGHCVGSAPSPGLGDHSSPASVPSLNSQLHAG